MYILYIRTIEAAIITSALLLYIPHTQHEKKCALRSNTKHREHPHPEQQQENQQTKGQKSAICTNNNRHETSPRTQTTAVPGTVGSCMPHYSTPSSFLQAFLLALASENFRPEPHSSQNNQQFTHSLTHHTHIEQTKRTLSDTLTWGINPRLGVGGTFISTRGKLTYNSSFRDIQQCSTLLL